VLSPQKRSREDIILDGLKLPVPVPTSNHNLHRFYMRKFVDSSSTVLLELKVPAAVDFAARPAAASIPAIAAVSVLPVIVWTVSFTERCRSVPVAMAVGVAECSFAGNTVKNLNLLDRIGDGHVGCGDDDLGSRQL